MLGMRALLVFLGLSSLVMALGGALFSVEADDGHDTYVSAAPDGLLHLKRHQIRSRILKGQRIIDIALPASYAETSETHRYPVIVVMDGELLFPMVSGMVHQMSANSQMPDSIVIGLQNSAGTRRDITPKPLNREGKPYWFGGEEDLYLRFLSEEMLPFIENKYRAADFRTLVGLSPTGQFALHAFWKAPALFDATVAINTANFKAVGYEEQDVFQKISLSANNPAHGSRALYISMPKSAYDRNPAISGAYQRLSSEAGQWLAGRSRLKTESIDKSAYAATLPAIVSALEFIFPVSDWDPSYRTFLSDVPGETLANVKSYFQKLSENYGFPVLPKGERFYNRNRLKRLGYVMLQQKRISEAVDIFQYWVQLYPGSANAYDSLADALDASGNSSAALEARAKAVSLAAKNQDYRRALFETKLNELRDQSTNGK